MNSECIAGVQAGIDDRSRRVPKCFIRKFLIPCGKCAPLETSSSIFSLYAKRTKIG